MHPFDIENQEIIFRAELIQLLRFFPSINFLLISGKQFSFGGPNLFKDSTTSLCSGILFLVYD